MEWKDNLIIGGICAAIGLVGLSFYASRQPRIEVKQVCEQKISFGSEQYKPAVEMAAPEMYKELGRIEGNIRSSLDEIKKGLNDMRGNYEGTPGLPSKTGIGDLFPGPGQKDESEGQNENKGDEQSSNPHRSLQQICEDIKAGRKALEVQREIFETIKGNVPSVPDIPRIYEENQNKEEKK